MKETDKRKIAFSYVGALAGSGFISGREIYQFFGRFGILGIIGVFITVSLMTFLIYSIIELSRREESVLTERIVCGKNRVLEKIFSIYFHIFYYALIVIMTAGFGSLVEELFNIHHMIGSFILVILVIIASEKGAFGLSNIMNFLMPILMVLMITLCINAIFIKDAAPSEPSQDNFIISALSFFAYNSIVASTSIFNAMYGETDKRILKRGALYGNILVLIIMLLMTIPMALHGGVVKDADFPTIALANLFNPYVGKIFNLLLMGGFFSSGTALLFAFTVKLKDNKNLDKIRWITMISAFLLSSVGFKELISLILPISGYVGIIAALMILYRRYFFK